MATLLHLDSSIDPVHSRSRQVTAAFAAAWRARGADHTVVYRDLHAEPIPHLADAALHWPASMRRADAAPPAEAERLQSELIAELLAADVVLIGAPMYNYSVPSTLKAWIDHVHVPTVTSGSPADTGPLAGRPAVVVSARGALYDEGTPSADWDHTVPPLRIILGDTFGMDVDVILTSVTLADFLPALAELQGRADAELAAAIARASELGSTLGA